MGEKKEEPKIEMEKKLKDLNLSDVKQLPDWEEDGTIKNIMQIEKNFHGKKEIFYVSIYSKDGQLHERLLNYNEPKFIPTTGMRKEDLQLKHFGVQQTFEELKALNKKYIYFDKEIYYDLVTLGSMCSYFREVFNHFSYFDFVSPEYNCGKTTALTCLILASYNGFICSDASESAIFRIVEDTKGSLGYDDIDYVFRQFKGSPANENILRLFTSGHTKGMPAVRVEEINKRRIPIPYDSFSMKGFTRTKGLPPALESRCIKIPMLRAPKSWNNPKEEPKEETFRSVRAKMYMYRLRMSEIVRKRYGEVRALDIGIHHRARDNALPLLTIASLISQELYTKVLGYLREETEQQTSNGGDIWGRVMFDIIIANKLLGQVTINHIRNLFNAKLIELGEVREQDKPMHSKTVASILLSMGFKRGQPDKNGYNTILITKERLEELRIFYTASLNSTVSSVSSVEPPAKDKEKPSEMLTISESPEDDFYEVL